MVSLQIMDSIFYEAQRQGKLSFYLTSTGEEAINITTAAALSPYDIILPQVWIRAIRRISRTYMTQILHREKWHRRKLDPSSSKNRSDQSNRSFPAWIENFSYRLSRLSFAQSTFHGSIPPEISRLSGTLSGLFLNPFSFSLFLRLNLLFLLLVSSRFSYALSFSLGSHF